MFPISCTEPSDPSEGKVPGEEQEEPIEGPSYKIGDFYHKGLAKGIIVDLNEEGTEGLLMSIDEAELMWSTEYEIITGAVETSMEDGQINCEGIKTLFSDWSQTYPAVAWCNQKNPGSLSSWYLPAGYELEGIWTASYENQTLFNETLVANGGMELSWGSSDFYWSSTDAGPAIAYAYSFETGEIDYYACDKQLKHRVRCVRKFTVQ